MCAAAVRSALPEAETSAPARRYGAFLSYSHRDAQLVAKLQRGLETYRLPPRLAGRETAVGPVPRSVGPIFRDRDELPAGADLATHVLEGLAASRWLIVVCSPAAAASPWVEREILEFKRLHGEDRVLAVIASGEPYASRIAGREAEECFPLALRHARADDGTPSGAALEPIAVDLRKQGDGQRMALLKLVAGMTGVGVDELAQRDAQRRARRLAWLAVGAVAGMLAMGVLAYNATQARNEARAQRAQAEGLIEFMLGDLRQKLEPVGRLEVLDAVGSKALDYYNQQDIAALDATSLGHRSRAMHLIGDIRRQRGQREPSEAAFREAAQTTAALLARAPNDTQRIFDHSQSEFWVGLAAYERGNLPSAREHLGNYLTLAKRLVALEPDKPDWQIEYGMASMNLGVILTRQRHHREALVQFEQARAAFEPLMSSRSELFIETATVQGWISEAYEHLDELAKSTVAQRAKLPLFDRMPDSAKNRRVLMGRVNTHYTLNRLLLSQGQFEAAEQEGQRAVAYARELVAADATNQSWQAEFAFAHLNLAEAQMELGRPDRARATIEPVTAVMAKLRGADPANLDWNIVMPGRWLDVAMRSEARSPAVLIAEMRSYLANAHAVVDQPANQTITRTRQLASLELQLGQLLAAHGDLPAAQSQWRATLDYLDRTDPNPEQPPAYVLRARLLLALGQPQAAAPYVARLRASALRSAAAQQLLKDAAVAASVTSEKKGSTP